MAGVGSVPDLISDTDPEALGRAAAVLEAGGTVVLPTDTVYGLAALPSVAGATDRLFRSKARSHGQPLAVLVAGVDQFRSLVDDGAETALVARWTARFWPGPLTLVVPRAPEAQELELGGADSTVGIRCPDHHFVRRLAERVGPVATTSANRHGEPTPVTAAAAAAALAEPVDLVVDGGPAGTVASTVVDLTGAHWKILRAGAISEADLRGEVV